jgi:hypothetical protein
MSERLFLDSLAPIFPNRESLAVEHYLTCLNIFIKNISLEKLNTIQNLIYVSGVHSDVCDFFLNKVYSETENKSIETFNNNNVKHWIFLFSNKNFRFNRDIYRNHIGFRDSGGVLKMEYHGKIQFPQYIFPKAWSNHVVCYNGVTGYKLNRDVVDYKQCYELIKVLELS